MESLERGKCWGCGRVSHVCLLPLLLGIIGLKHPTSTAWQPRVLSRNGIQVIRGKEVRPTVVVCWDPQCASERERRERGKEGGGGGGKKEGARQYSNLEGAQKPK
jgi:hypothetical protein